MIKYNNLKFEEILDDHVKNSNQNPLFTPGPSSLCAENILSLKPAFGRGDEEYLITENKVLKQLLKLSGHQNIVRLQGSSSLALEIAILNFVKGRVLLIDMDIILND